MTAMNFVTPSGQASPGAVAEEPLPAETAALRYTRRGSRLERDRAPLLPRELEGGSR